MWGCVRRIGFFVLFGRLFRKLDGRIAELTITALGYCGKADGDKQRQEEKPDGIPQIKSHRDSPILLHFEDFRFAFLARQFLATLYCTYGCRRYHVLPNATQR